MMDGGACDFTEDEKGFFYIYVKDGEIVVEHYENKYLDDAGKRIITGKINRVFRGTRADEIYRKVLGEDLVSRMDHAAYLGAELGKAQACIENGIEYEQDG